MNKKVVLLLLIVGILFVLTGCLPGDGKNTSDDPAGFFWGVWHGWMAPFSVIMGIFNKSIRVYEVNNTGWIYDVGFYMAVISGFGGVKIVRDGNKKKKDD